MLILFIDIYFSIGTFCGIIIAIGLCNVLVLLAIRIMLKNKRDRELKHIVHHHEINLQLKDNLVRAQEQKLNNQAMELRYKDSQLEKNSQRLARQSWEINQINSMEELNNWKLQNNMKAVLHEGLLEEAMDYKQFQLLYPDSFTCCRFIDTLKWNKEFSCRKCSNEKYFEGAQKFARRCTKCGYNESITAFTIFHSIKFPIEKAFYIAYLVVSGKKDYTLEMLATQLDLRVNTVWGFKHKVAERITELEKRGKKPVISRWEEVILFDEFHVLHNTNRSSKHFKTVSIKAKA